MDFPGWHHPHSQRQQRSWPEGGNAICGMRVRHTEQFSKLIPGRRPATDRRLRAAVSGLGSSVRRLADQPVLAFPGRPHCPAGAGDGGAEVRCATRVAGDVYGKRLRAGSKWETAGKRPGARGNIEGRRRAYLANAGLRPHGRRCACCGSRNVAVARRRARSSSAEMPRPAHAWLVLGITASPGDPRSCACPAMNPGARENQCALARQAVRRRSHSNEENH